MIFSQHSVNIKVSLRLFFILRLIRASGVVSSRKSGTFSLTILLLFRYAFFVFLRVDILSGRLGSGCEADLGIR
jgi:hypothetical protein